MGSKPVSESTLFTPLKVGNITLQHRVVLAPLTRLRASAVEHVPGEFVEEYYSQRAGEPGTLLISEGTLISARAGGMPSVPGIWSEEQIKAWKKITDAVHAKGSFMFLQLWALGRTASVEVLANEPGGPYPHVAPSAIPLESSKTDVPRALSTAEIKEYIELHAQAAENAIRAGFDGVEVHCANGYLLDQFLSDASNQRTDEYGGSIENRSRFPFQVIDSVVKRVGAERVGFRITPFGDFQEVKMKDPIPQFTHSISSVASNHPNLAYLHAVEPRLSSATYDKDASELNAAESLDFARKVWGDRVFFSAGGYTPELALSHIEKKGSEKDAIVFGRWFIANPDLPKRIKNGIPLTKYDRSKFYNAGQPEGYIDYPFA